MKITEHQETVVTVLVFLAIAVIYVAVVILTGDVDIPPAW